MAIFYDLIMKSINTHLYELTFQLRKLITSMF